LFLKGTIVFSITNYIAGDQRMQRICAALISNAFHVTLIGRKPKEPNDLADYLFETRQISCFFSKGKAFYFEYNFRLFWRLLFTKADIFGAVDLDTILPVLAVAWLKGKRATYDAHEYFTEVPEVYARQAIRKIWKTVERFALPKMDAHYTVTESIALLFKAEYNLNFTVIRNLSRLKENRPGTAGEKFILYQGALNRGRGLEKLIEAMPSIDMNLKIAGRGDVEMELHALVKKLGLQEKVNFLGFLNPDQLDQISYQAFLGYNLLENQGKSYYYSLANKTFDYMQAGIPVLCSPFPEYLALEQEYSFIYFSELTVSEIIRSVNFLINNPTEYEIRKQAALEAKQVLNWEMEQIKLAQIYNDLFG